MTFEFYDIADRFYLTSSKYHIYLFVFINGKFVWYFMFDQIENTILFSAKLSKQTDKILIWFPKQLKEV